MAWNKRPIVGSKSVAQNKKPINDNFAYIEDKIKLDHYFVDSNDNLNGHHRFVQMDNQASDPTLDADMESVLYAKEITTDTTSFSHLFGITNNSTAATTHIYMSPMVLASGFITDTNTATPVITKGFNIASFVRNSKGVYTITFTNPLPADQYIFLGTPMTGQSSAKATQLSTGRTDGSYKNVYTTSSIKIYTWNGTNAEDAKMINFVVLSI